MTPAAARAEPAEVDRGAELVARLGPPPDDERARSVLADIPAALGVPFVSPIFSTLAHYPSYLASVWRVTSPALGGDRFEQAAGHVRAQVPLELLPPHQALAPSHDLQAVAAYVDTLHWLLPKVLLVAAAWHRRLTESLPPAQPVVAPPRGIHPAASALGPTTANDDRVAEIYRQLQDAHRQPRVLSVYRALSLHPELLAATWAHMQPLVGTPAHDAALAGVLQAAGERTADVPGLDRGQARAAGLDDARIEEVSALLALYRFRMIPPLLLDITAAKALLDGPASAHTAALRQPSGAPQSRRG